MIKRCSFLDYTMMGMLAWAVSASLDPAQAAIVFETTSPYHHIQVVDQQGIRTLYFDASTETKMSIADPLKGHCEYTEYFHLPWLWHPSMTNVLMIGLGGASVQRTFQHDYPQVLFETAELDPKVVQVAKQYFHLQETAQLKIHLSDGRVFLRRSQKKYDAIFLDAYTASRYGSFVPYSLATKEFFILAKEHLTPQGVLAYNVIGNVYGSRTSLLSSLYVTLKSVFPQVYLFPVVTSQNVIVIATQSPNKDTLPELQKRAGELIKSGRIALPNFQTRLGVYRVEPPSNAGHARILTDDFAPIDGLINTAD